MRAKGSTKRRAGESGFTGSLSSLTFAFRSSELTSQSDKTLDVHFFERSFETSQHVAALAATSTKFGMTTKNIIGQQVLSMLQSETLPVNSSRDQEGPDTVDPEEVA